MAKSIVRQLIELRILEWSHAVSNHVELFFRHKRAERMFKLWRAIEVDKERATHLHDGVVIRQQTDKVGKTLGDRDVTQFAAVCDAREQHLVLIATAKDFLYPAHEPGGGIVRFHLAVERIAHHRAVKKP